MKTLYFQSQCSLGGFDPAHKTQALSAWWLMKAPKLCVRKKKEKDIKHGYLNGAFVSVGSLVLYICSVDLQEVFS